MSAGRRPRRLPTHRYTPQPHESPPMTATLTSDRHRLPHEFNATVRLAAPLVLGQLSAVGMTLIDTMLAGHLDAHTLGAVALGSNVWVLAIITIIGMMMALQPSVAHLRGAGREPGHGQGCRAFGNEQAQAAAKSERNTIDVEARQKP